MELAFDELLDGDGSVDSMTCEGVLKDFEVLNVCVFSIDIELDAAHGHIQVDRVKYLAEGSTSTALLHLGNIQL